MKKTVREWLEELPEPYRTQAIENTDPERLDIQSYASSMDEALGCSFVFEYSPQKHKYWRRLQLSYRFSE